MNKAPMNKAELLAALARIDEAHLDSLTDAELRGVASQLRAAAQLAETVLVEKGKTNP